ncbi:barstar family protein [Crossiella sp. SN42]|uniref:barstar family protein n=1 Tax=Crossiella sp. SN42 TaxID=2944808 RepID=UPI00207C714C|nr:barstar family protein [Crossiella sp. SN42]MCO1577891.1 barstar family protein [Crossiella sp. SN42]
MNRCEAVLSPGRPWVHVLTRSEAGGPRTVHLPDSGLVVQLDAKKMTDVDELFDQFADGFRFPTYFGRNWSAFAECINDLEWLPAHAYLVIIDNADRLLLDAPLDRPAFIRNAHDTGKRWANSFALGEERGGGEVPFNFVLVCPEDQQAKLSSAVEEALR